MINARIATLEAPGRLVFTSEQIDPNSLGDGQLLCESLVSVISPGTELAAFTGAPPLRPGVTYPRVVGYCNVARVIGCGAGTRGFRNGDRVLSFTSHRSHFIIPAADVLTVLPQRIADEHAACAYLYHLGYSALLKANILLGSTVVVIGMGVLGLGAVAVSAMAGAKVFAISNHLHSRKLGLEMGATACFDRTDLGQLKAELGERGANAVITTSNAWEDWRTALEVAGLQASITVLGFPGRQEPQADFNPLDSAHFYSRQLRILAAGVMPELPDSRGFLPFNERENLKKILSWIDDGALQPALLLSGQFVGRDLSQAYERLLQRDGSSLTYSLRWAD